MITFNDKDYTYLEFQDFIEKYFPDSNEKDAISQMLWAFCESQAGISIIAPDGTTLLSNTAHQEIVGVKGKEIVGKNVSVLVSEGIIQRSAAAEVLRTKKKETLIQTLSNGKVALVVARPLFDGDDELKYVVSNIFDVPMLKRTYEEKLKQDALLENYQQVIEKKMRREVKDVIVTSAKMRSVMSYVERIASNDSSVLILGESGVGKGIIAKAIHSMGRRSDKPFISINCGAIPEQLLESELFGYCKGAFTGANKEGKVGLLEMADGGTIMLDEIGELPMSLQPKVLKFLEEGIISKIGSTETKVVDSRIIAATNRNLREMVENNLFREDLYYRLNVIPLRIPPLRERPEDIAPLTMHFLNLQNKKTGENRKFSSGLIKALEAFKWPGNVRQLRNMVERLLALSGEEVISETELDDLVNEELYGTLSNMEDVQWPIDFLTIRREFEDKWVEKAMLKGGSIRAAAKLLGITPSMMYRYINR